MKIDTGSGAGSAGANGADGGGKKLGATGVRGVPVPVLDPPPAPLAGGAVLAVVTTPAGTAPGGTAPAGGPTAGAATE